MKIQHLYKKHIMRYYLFLLAIILFVNCSKDEAQSALASKSMGAVDLEMEEQAMTPTLEESTDEPLDNSLEKGSKIIKEGNLRFDVDNLRPAKQKVDSLLSLSGGYYENERYNSYGHQNEYDLKIRVPNEKFDSFVNLLEKGIGTLQSKNISAKDVTEEYVDLTIRLDNNIAYLNQYKEILKKARTIKEILEVQEKIRRIESEIDSKKGRIKYLNDKVQYSTVHLELSETREVVRKEDGFISRVGSAFGNGFESFLTFLVVLVNLWPFILLVIIFLIFRKRLVGMFRRGA